MPTYRNDDSSGKFYVVTDYLGVSAPVLAGGSVQTYKLLSAPFTKTSDAPYFPAALVDQPSLTTPTTLSSLVACKKISVMAKNSGIVMKFNVAANTYPITLPSGVWIDFVNNGEIDALVFTGAGEVSVIGM